MNRQTRTFVVLVVAVVVAAAASYAVPRRRQHSGAAGRNRHRESVVAARPLPIGTLVTREHQVIDWPARTPLEADSRASNKCRSRAGRTGRRERTPDGE